MYTHQQWRVRTAPRRNPKPRRDARATNRSDLSKSDERDSGKTREKAQPLSMLAEVRGKFPAVIFLIFNYKGCKRIAQGDSGIDQPAVGRESETHPAFGKCDANFCRSIYSQLYSWRHFLFHGHTAGIPPGDGIIPKAGSAALSRPTGCGREGRSRVISAAGKIPGNQLTSWGELGG